MPSKGPLDSVDSVCARTSRVRSATQRRQQAAAERLAAVLRDGEHVEGLLRRKTVSKATGRIYQAAHDAFFAKYQLRQRAPLALVDEMLDKELVQLYMSGEGQKRGRILYYGVRWVLSLRNEELRLASTVAFPVFMKSAV